MNSNFRPLKAVALAALVVVGAFSVQPAEAIVIYWWGHRLVLRIYVPFFGPIDPVTDVLVYSNSQTLDEDFLPDPVITGTGDLGTWDFDYVTDSDQDIVDLTTNGVLFSLTNNSGDQGISNGNFAEFQFRSTNHPFTPQGTMSLAEDTRRVNCHLPAVSDYLVSYFDSAADNGNGAWTYDVQPRCVPEPQILGLMAAGLTLLAGLQRRRKPQSER